MSTGDFKYRTLLRLLKKKGGIMEALSKLQTELKLRGFSPLTVRNYSFFVQKFLIFSDKQIEDLNEDDIKAYLASMFDTKSKNTY